MSKIKYKDQMMCKSLKDFEDEEIEEEKLL